MQTASQDLCKKLYLKQNRRRKIQEIYNKEHNITPVSIKKSVTDILATIYESDYYTVPLEEKDEVIDIAPEKISQAINTLDKEMKKAAKNLEYETAAKKRDKIKKLKRAGAGISMAQRKKPANNIITWLTRQMLFQFLGQLFI